MKTVVLSTVIFKRLFLFKIMNKTPSQPSSSQLKKVSLSTSAVANLSPATMSLQAAQPTQSILGETLKQMNATLQGYAIHFFQQDKNMVDLNATTDKSMAELKVSVDKSLTGLKSSVDQLCANTTALSLKFQDFDSRLD